MRGAAMRRVCDDLERRGFDLSRARALEFFAREGDWQATAYVGRVASLEAWEVDAAREARLRANLPHATVRIVDSIVFASRPENRGRFDFVVLDNPQGCFGPGARYCEHFEALEAACGLLSERAVLVFNVNRTPFDFDRFPAWQARRSRYYGVDDASRLSASFLLAFYRSLLERRGLSSPFAFEVARNPEYLSYLVCLVERAGAAPA
jgi:hypothetical protein